MWRVKFKKRQHSLFLSLEVRITCLLQRCIDFRYPLFELSRVIWFLPVLGSDQRWRIHRCLFIIGLVACNYFYNRPL
ncbi:hypothetical protein BDZ94DRAFT_1245997 [Collybia nuda]|uniref:Uncharacterized protein n=1 Tax=Collybia nuda TaxID=64659 RepID=A0A9P5YG63_9AGAR|nr:hypothetical protein BDZ94DRAFT_1245997 [Collybia nuda]